MQIQEEAMLQIKQKGVDAAASIWETLEHLPQPIEPTDIFKAISSVKCAEFIARIKTNKLAPVLMQCVAQFLVAAVDVLGDNEGVQSEGVRVLAFIDKTMPMTDAIFNDAEAYAIRQHAYDGILLLAAVRLGKETEAKKCIDDMQAAVAKALIASYLKESILSGIIDFDPDKVQA